MELLLNTSLCVNRWGYRKAEAVNRVLTIKLDTRDDTLMFDGYRASWLQDLGVVRSWLIEKNHEVFKLKISSDDSRVIYVQMSDSYVYVGLDVAVKVDNEKSTSRIIAKFIPQADADNELIDLDPVYFDVTNRILSLSVASALALRDDGNLGELWFGNEASESFKHEGPFRIEVEEAIQQFFISRLAQTGKASV